MMLYEIVKYMVFFSFFLAQAFWKIVTTQVLSHVTNDFITTVIVEQPLASPWSANNKSSKNPEKTLLFIGS